MNQSEITSRFQTNALEDSLNDPWRNGYMIHGERIIHWTILEGMIDLFLQE